MMPFADRRTLVLLLLLLAHCLPSSVAAAEMKKALRETQTLRAGCSKAEPKIFSPPQAPSQGRRTATI